jgi:dipeptidase E
MKLLLTSLGITNGTIRTALEDLIGKPLGAASAVCVPTAIYAMPHGGSYGWQILDELGGQGWREFSLLELTALPSINTEDWLPMLLAADALVVSGGNTPFLSYWMQRSGLADRLPDLLPDLVYVGISAGSMVVTHSLHVDRDHLARTGVYADDLYGDVAPYGAGSDRTLGLTDFVIRPHLNGADYPTLTIARLAEHAAGLDVPVYAIDDRTAVRVVDGRVDVVSEGDWRLFDPSAVDG